MKMSHLYTGILLISVFVCVHMAQSAAKWERLGARTVKHSVDRDVILVGAKEGAFTAVKLTVKKAGLHFLDMKVHFVNRDVQDVEIRKFIANGGETRVIDLVDKDRRIEKVVFWYKTTNKNERDALVRLWGRH